MRVRLESVADWLAASDPGPQLTSSDYPGPALTFDLPRLSAPAEVKKPWPGVGEACGKKRKKTDNPREGWEDGTPPPHRDFKERCVVR